MRVRDTYYFQPRFVVLKEPDPMANKFNNFTDLQVKHVSKLVSVGELATATPKMPKVVNVPRNLYPHLIWQAFDGKLRDWNVNGPPKTMFYRLKRFAF